MRNREILEKAIEKAKSNGFKYPHYADELVFWLDVENSGFEGYYALIFSHDFCKAFFGEEGKKKTDFEYMTLGASYEWEALLQEMILTKKPLKYLEKYL